MLHSPANIEISITIIFWYRPDYCYDDPQREEIVLHWLTDVIIGSPGVLFWLRSSGGSGSLRGWHEALWRWSRAGCWIISGGVCCVAVSPPRDFDRTRHHFNVFIWWPMLQIKILSDLRGELYTSRNDGIIQMQPRRWRVGGESMCSGCQSVCPVSVASVSLSLDTSRSVCQIIITILSLQQNKQ